MLRKLFQIFAIIALVVIIILGIVFYFKYGATVIDLKDEADILVDNSDAETFRSSQTSVIFDAEGNQITALSGEKDVYYVYSDSIPAYFVDAMTSVEDRKFYKHNGVDNKAVLRAAWSFVKHKGEITQGGSTITQQLARNIFLTHSVTWERKAEEMFIAWNLEDKYTKDEIMEFYLNNIYFANGYYGIGAAAKGYFGMEVSELSLSQIAFLCAIPNSPTYYDPRVNFDNTIERRDKILLDMLECDKISSLDYEMAVGEAITLVEPEAAKNNYVETYIYDCATEAIMENEGFVFQNVFASDEDEGLYWERYNTMYDECRASLYTGGFRIYTSIEMDKQQELQDSLDEVLDSNDEVNDEGIFALQGAATCVNNDTGKVVAIVGGRDQEVAGYSLNRAYQSPRQPGSTIKPLIVYTPALERNYTPNSIVDDSPIQGGPSNAGGYEGEITLTRAVTQSKNVVAYRLYEELTPVVGIQYIINMGFENITAEDREIMSPCLGGFTYGVTTEEMAGAYSALASDGQYVKPTCINKITDPDDNIILEIPSEKKHIYDINAARSMTSILSQTFYGGTATGLALDNMPCAAKTGTTNDNKDGWFVGYTPYYSTAVWVGFDIPRAMSSLYGNSYPGSIWKSYMNKIHQELPYKEFILPENIQEASTEEASTEEASTEEASTEGASTEEATTEDSSTEAAGTEAVNTEERSEEQITTEAPVTETPITVENSTEAITE